MVYWKKHFYHTDWCKEGRRKGENGISFHRLSHVVFTWLLSCPQRGGFDARSCMPLDGHLTTRPLFTVCPRPYPSVYNVHLSTGCGNCSAHEICLPVGPQLMISQLEEACLKTTVVLHPAHFLQRIHRSLYHALVLSFLYVIYHSFMMALQRNLMYSVLEFRVSALEFSKSRQVLVTVTLYKCAWSVM